MSPSCYKAREYSQFYLTWWSHACRTNQDGINCLKAEDDASFALRSAASLDEVCAALRVMGCCGGSFLDALEAAGWQHQQRLFEELFDECDVKHDESCDGDDGNKTKSTVIGLSVALAIVGVLALVLIVYFVKRNRRAEAESAADPPPGDHPMVTLPHGVAMGIPVDDLPPLQPQQVTGATPAYNVTVSAAPAGDPVRAISATSGAL